MHVGYGLNFDLLSYPPIYIFLMMSPYPFPICTTCYIPSCCPDVDTVMVVMACGVGVCITAEIYQITLYLIKPKYSLNSLTFKITIYASAYRKWYDYRKRASQQKHLHKGSMVAIPCLLLNCSRTGQGMTLSKCESWSLSSGTWSCKLQLWSSILSPFTPHFAVSIILYIQNLYFSLLFKIFLF